MKTIFKGNNFAIVWNIIDSSTHTPFDFSGMKVEVELYSECCKKAIKTYNISNGTIEFEVESEELQNGVYNLMCRYSTENEQAYCIYKRAFQITGKPEFASNVETIILESKASHIDATDHDDPIPDFENCQLIAQELFKENFRLPQLTADRAIADEHGNRIADTYVSRKSVTKHIRNTYNQQFLENPPLITEGYITPQMLSDETRQLLEESGATINNLPDGEDLQSVHGVLKLANKQHNPNSYSGLGRQYLRKNIVAGQNILTQSMLQCPNTIYIIQYDYDLQGSEITIPENCVLQFEGGSLNNGTIIGNNTAIKAELIKIFSLDINLLGTWNVAETYPEWFGAKGDGVTDDTKAIKLCGKFGVNSTMVFQQKTYIVNVIQGIDNSQRHILSGLKTSHIKGNGAIIRLGDNNNCDLRNHKGFGSLFNIQSQASLVVENLTIDFNYAQNPIYQTEGRSQTVQENTQQNAFCIRDIKNVIIDSCTFIEHSGTNCIDWLMYDSWADGDMYVRISNCKFLKCGKVSYYDNNGTIETAAHDVSTCALHYRTHSTTYKYKLDFINNYIEGVGINAYNALECSPTELNFSNNIVEGFKYCVMPCAYVNHMNVMITNNKFLKTGCPITIWDRGYQEEVSIIDSFDNLVAINNTTEIDIPYWEKTKDYICIVNGVNRIYGFLRTVAGVSKNYGGNLIIRNNNINYLNPEQIATAFETVGDISKVTTFNLYQLCVDELTKSSMSDFIIDSNVITNSPITLLSIAQVSKINHLRITNNIFYNIGYLREGGLMYLPIIGNSNMTERGIDEIHILNNFIDNKNTMEDNMSILFGSGFYNPTLGNIAYVEGNRYTKSNILSLISNYSVNINSENFFVTAPKGGNSVKPALKIGADIGHSYINTFWKVFEIWDGEKWIDGLGFPSMPASFAFNGIPGEADMGSNPGSCKFNTSINKPVFWNGSYWVDANGVIIDYALTKPLIGDTDNRQSFTPHADSVGLQNFDTTLNKPIWWTGTKWVDATGTEV